MRIIENYTIINIVNQINNGKAKKVSEACFRQGIEDEIRIDFYRLCGEIIRIVHNRSDTTTKYFFVKNENKNLFNANFGVNDD